MRALRGIGKWFWRFMIIFSFVVNVILVLTLVVLLLVIFDIKHNVAQPLVEGLHSSFVGLNDSTIDWTIPVRTSIPLDTSIPLNTSIPLDTDTTVTLTQDVSFVIYNAINIGGFYPPIDVTLPTGLVLPVHLDLDVPVNLEVPVDLDVPVSLDVRAVIPLAETQLHDPVENLRLLFEPLVRVLGNLPDDFSEVGGFAGQVLSGSPPNLLADTPYSLNPWPGYSQTAGLNYDLANVPFPPENVPVLTGIIPTGGIPALDEGVRAEAYAADADPGTINAQAAGSMGEQGIPAQYYDGTYAQTILGARDQAAGNMPTASDQGVEQSGVGTGDTGQGGVSPTPEPPTPEGDLGIIPPSSP